MVQLLANERELAADLSHRLRTPLTVLRLNAASLGEGDAAQQTREAVDQLEREVDKIIRTAREQQGRPPEASGGQAGCDAAEVVRERFGGRVTYAAGPWELVDWAPYDIVGVDAYRASYNAHDFTDELRARFEYGKPVAVTEFGTCPYRGAGELGGMAWAVPASAIPASSNRDPRLTIMPAILPGAAPSAIRTPIS